MNFYNRDANAEKVVIITFDCKEVIEEVDGEERKAGETVAPRSAAGGTQNLANLFMKETNAKAKGMKPMEFSVLYLV